MSKELKIGEAPPLREDPQQGSFPEGPEEEANVHGQERRRDKDHHEINEGSLHISPHISAPPHISIFPRANILLTPKARNTPNRRRRFTITRSEMRDAP